MTENLQQLLKAARTAKATPEQQEQQRQSFAYGNTAFENPLITREMVTEQAEAIERERSERGKERTSG